MNVLLKLIIILQLVALAYIYTVKPYGVDKDPGNSHLHFYVAKRLYDQGRYVQAREQLNRVIATHNGDLTAWSLYTMMGNIELKLGCIPAAKRCYRQALRLNPTFKPAVRGLRKIIKLQSKYEHIKVRIR